MNRFRTMSSAWMTSYCSSICSSSSPSSPSCPSSSYSSSSLLLLLSILFAHLAFLHPTAVFTIAPARQPSLAVRLELLPKRVRLLLQQHRVRLQLPFPFLLLRLELLQRRPLEVLQRREMRRLPRGGMVRRVELVALESDVRGWVVGAVAAHVVVPVAALHAEGTGR